MSNPSDSIGAGLDLKHYWTGAPFRVAVQGDLLRAHLAESEIILRLGTIANGLLSIGRAVRSSDDTLAGLRDQVQSRTLLASHAKESAKILNRRHAGLGWTLAEEGVRAGHRLSKVHLAELCALLQDGSQFLLTCIHVRNDYGFHIGSEPVNRWLSDPARAETVVLETVEGEGVDSWLFDVSAQVLFDATPPEVRSVRFGDELLFFARTLPMLVEAMITGFMNRYGVDLAMMDGIKTDEFSLNPTQSSVGTIVIEIRPARMVWFPFFIGMPSEEAAQLSPQLCETGPRGGPLNDIEVMPKHEYPGWWIRFSKEAVLPAGRKICLVCRKTPGPLIFGRPSGPRYRLILDRHWRPRPGSLPLAPPDVVG